MLGNILFGIHAFLTYLTRYKMKLMPKTHMTDRINDEHDVLVLFNKVFDVCFSQAQNKVLFAYGINEKLLVQSIL
jgi:hypothetical protein